jgi:D-tyrosyl-tRNA(Tyr) deacylase
VRALIQRVSEARAIARGQIIGTVGPGLCVFLGVGKNDSEAQAEFLARKITRLRVFADEHGKMNRSLLEHGGEVLVVSQFTLYADCDKGNRPSFTDAAPGPQALKLYRYFVEHLQQAGVAVATGEFQAVMNIALVNDGPVTFLLES